jgi:uncharacterized membrane protein
MNGSSRLPAVLAYLIPVIGWVYIYFVERKNPLALYHLRQVVGLTLFLVAIVAGWGILAWIIVWIPYMAVISMALFTLVIAAYLFGAIAWIMGLINALRGRAVPLPGVGRWASRLPIQPA